MNKQHNLGEQSRREAMKRAGWNFIALAFAAAGGLAKDKREADERKGNVSELPYHVRPENTCVIWYRSQFRSHKLE